MIWRRIALNETDSTNIYINKVEEENVVVTAEYQTAGRGQGTNRWESERGKNLLFSIKVAPRNFPANRQFLLSMAGALAVKAALNEFVDEITLKWPNDIYWRDKKICGTLILTSIQGKFLQSCIFGVGLNVNQQQFCSDAPNPVSLWQILGKEVSREELLESILRHFEDCYGRLVGGDEDSISADYHAALYRRDGFHKYADGNGEFLAETVGVRSDGHLVLRTEHGLLKQYEFKDLKFIL